MNDMFGIDCPHMKQAYSLQKFCSPIPRALPWASMREAVGLLTLAS